MLLDSGHWQLVVAATSSLQSIFSNLVADTSRSSNTAAALCSDLVAALGSSDCAACRMVGDGVQPNTKTYTALIMAFSKAGRLESVLDVLQELVMVSLGHLSHLQDWSTTPGWGSQLLSPTLFMPRSDTVSECTMLSRITAWSPVGLGFL